MGIVFAEIKLILRVILWIGILIGVTLICHLMWPDLKKARVIPGQAALPDPKADQDVTMFREGLLRHGVSSDSGPEIAGKLKWMIDTEKTGSIFSWGPFVYSTPAVREGLVILAPGTECCTLQIYSQGKSFGHIAVGISLVSKWLVA